MTRLTPLLVSARGILPPGILYGDSCGIPLEVPLWGFLAAFLVSIPYKDRYIESVKGSV
jgi:hypothetical protein